MMKSVLPITAVALALLAMAPPAGADTPATGALEVARGRAVAVTLDRPARNVVVGDPAVADVSVQNARQLLLFGKSAGATSLTVTDGAGRPILEATVVVPPGGGAGDVSIHHGAGKGVETGGRTVVFSCAQGCVRVPDPKHGTPAAAPAPAGK